MSGCEILIGMGLMEGSNGARFEGGVERPLLFSLRL